MYILYCRHWAKINGGPSDDALALAALQLTAASPSAASISHIHEQPGASMTGSVRAGRIPSKDVAALAELEPEVVVVADDGVHKSVTKEHLNVPKWNGRALHIQVGRVTHAIYQPLRVSVPKIGINKSCGRSCTVAPHQ